MNANVPVSVILIALAVGGGFWLLYQWVKSIRESAQRTVQVGVELGELRKALALGTAAMDHLRITLAPATEEMHANMVSVPKILEAISKVGQMQVEIMMSQRADLKQQSANPFGKPNTAFPPRDTTDANLEFDVSQLMRSGMTREQALMQLNTANAGSVWDGNSVFDGWAGGR